MSDFVHNILNKLVINKLSYAVPVRPRPLSMAEDYVTWGGLTDKKYSGRHLPAKREYNAQLPDLDTVKELLRSTSDVRSPRSTLMLPIFAQWFTDSFLRTKFNVNGPQDFKENESNHEIDLCQIYGMTETQTAQLRSMENGFLKSQIINNEEFPAHLFEETASGVVQIKAEFVGLYTEANVQRVFARASKEHKLNCFAVGIEHGNSTMGNTLMNIIWLREHNRIAREIAKAHPTWNDEKLFQTARNVNIVLLLKVVVEDYIFHISGFPFKMDNKIAEGERWYRSNWMAAEFALLYRWHDLIPDTVEFGGERKDSSALNRNNRWLMKVGVDRACLDASKEPSGKIMLGNTPNFLVEVGKMSLTQGRVSGLASFNDYCEHYGLKRKKNFMDLTGNNKEVSKKLEKVYGSIDNLEWFVGLWAEAYDEKAQCMGKLLTMMVGNDAFTQALTNPLLAAEVFNEGTFSKEGFAIINDTGKLSDIIGRNSGLKNGEGVSFFLSGKSESTIKSIIDAVDKVVIALALVAVAVAVPKLLA
jgi:prostaglandin-endoperoxide synthase 2